MSTRTDATYDDATTSPRTDHTTDFSTGELSTSDARTRPDEVHDSGGSTASDAPTPGGDTSWTDQCKRQFSTTHTTRLTNLADDENQAMQDGV